MTPEERSQRARIAALTRWGKTTDRTAATAAATRAWHDKWEREADPDGVMPPEQRAKAADALKRAHYLRMQRKSTQARRRKRDTAA